jgi:hypothetical protein
MSRKLKAFLAIVVLLITVAAVAYFYLTKSQSVEVSIQQGQKYRIAGKYYEGKYGDRALEKIFSQMRSLLEEEAIRGELTVLYYRDPETETGRIKNFIGILPESGSQIPASLEVRSFSPENTITVRVHSHPAVMPRPNTIKEIMEEEVLSKGYELDSIFMEKYLSNEDIVVIRHLSKAAN